MPDSCFTATLPCALAPHMLRDRESRMQAADGCHPSATIKREDEGPGGAMITRGQQLRGRLDEAREPTTAADLCTVRLSASTRTSGSATAHCVRVESARAKVKRACSMPRNADFSTVFQFLYEADLLYAERSAQATANAAPTPRRAEPRTADASRDRRATVRPDDRRPTRDPRHLDTPPPPWRGVCMRGRSDARMSMSSADGPTAHSC